ncbi:Band 4.1-like protein 4B FERM-containing protein CG1 Protein EHM2 [Larimichthys crocea]|uniref:Band 4.1-like protein 4B FERM-containing protein CG1 Protein EHM2 n=1 Tax=Larimichthys crocea TaxID=215358 RepID=A0A6G0IBW3_LARCR|nr:Band 4.1-like protein 4B FERM-containing protein CG1 Protein EHM2 [Larimichthys crocea]
MKYPERDKGPCHVGQTFGNYPWGLCRVQGEAQRERYCVSFPLSGPASDHQFSVEENETSYSGKIHHHHRRHTHSQDTLCHTHTKNKRRERPPCTADELEISQSLLKALESESDSPPWPSLHVNMDKGEEKQLSEKSLHPPASPAMLPDHLKCNILKAQMEAAFRSSSQDSAASSLTADKTPHRQDCNQTPETLQSKVNTSCTRRKRLVRQFSFNHEDEDNLPEALAAISSQSTGKSGSTSSLDKQIQPSIYPQVDNMPALELGSPCCPSPSPSPHLSPSYYRSSIPHLAPYLATHNDSGEEMRLDREKILRALLMTEL